MKDINKMIAESSKTEEASVIKEKPQATKLKKNSPPAKNDFNRKSASFRKSSPKNRMNNTGGYSTKKKHR